MTHFVVIYDRASGHADVTSFDGPEAAERALAARFAAESGIDANVEVASLSAESIDELRATHGRYFRGAVDMVDDLGRLVQS